MNNLEISAYIDAKKKSRIYIENEISAAREILDEMKAQKPVRWYNNFYYILKRVVFIFLSSISVLFLISTFLDKDSYRQFFYEQYNPNIEKFLNDNFGSKSEIIISETSAVNKKIDTKTTVKEIRTDLRDKVVKQIFDYSFEAFQILLAFFTFLFWCVARLTRQLHLKNKKITDHYNINIDLMNIYSAVVTEQNYEIEFLEKATRNKVY